MRKLTRRLSSSSRSAKFQRRRCVSVAPCADPVENESGAGEGDVATSGKAQGVSESEEEEEESEEQASEDGSNESDEAEQPGAHDEEQEEQEEEEEEQQPEQEIKVRTAPWDPRFPSTNQVKHCYTRYNEFHKCAQEKGDSTDPECLKYKRWYRALCPDEWVEQWDEQRSEGRFAGRY